MSTTPSLFPEPDRVFTVSGFLDHINALVKPEYADIRGEVAEFKSTSQWTSFSLKDAEGGAVLKCVTGTWQYRKLNVALADGMAVQVGGYARITKSYGSFGLWFDRLELVGEGALRKAYEILKKQFEAEGVFARKRPLPEYVHTIGVISSKNGVVIQDFRKNVAPRGFHILFRDARVEGETAVYDIVSALHTLNHYVPDVIVIIRGGGSLESLQAFNSEAVVRAVFGSRVPVIAGIGHDVDVPLAALAADMMVSTPTAAAVLLNRPWDMLGETIRRHEHTLFETYERWLYEGGQQLALTSERLFTAYRGLFALANRYHELLCHNADVTQAKLREIDMHMIRMRTTMTLRFSAYLDTVRAKVARTEQVLVLANPERNLRLGYSIVFDTHGGVIKSAQRIHKGDELVSRFADGQVVSKVEKVTVNE